MSGPPSNLPLAGKPEINFDEDILSPTTSESLPQPQILDESMLQTKRLVGSRSVESMEVVALGSNLDLSQVEITGTPSQSADDSISLDQTIPLDQSICLDQSLSDSSVQLDTNAKDLEALGIGGDMHSQKEDESSSASKYFVDTPVNEGKDNFFDTLLASDSGEGDVSESKETKSLKVSIPEIKQPVSPTAEDATPVSFEETKGEGLKMIGSTANISKFFTDDGGNETEAKGFFDSFTAEAGDGGIGSQTPNQTPPATGIPATPPIPTPLPPVQTGIQPIATPPVTHVPQTPPQPSPIPTDTASPLPSPLHLGQQKSTMFGASPSPSPSHLGTTQIQNPLSQNIINPPPDLVEDPFTSSLLMSDVDRRHDAWLPSETTRQAIVAMVTSVPGTFIPDPEQLTRPGLMVDDPQGDPIRTLVHRFMGEAEALKRIDVLSVDDVSQDEDGVRQLIRAGCYRSAVDLTGRLLTNLGQGLGKLNQLSTHTPQSLQLWFTRIALWIKLRMYSPAETECQAFGSMDRPDLYFEFYPDKYPGRKGSMVPFEFRIIHSEIPEYMGKSQETLDRLYYVHAVTKKILSNVESGLAEDGSMLQLSEESRKAARELWVAREARVLYSVGNSLLQIKDYGAAIEVFESLTKKDEKNAANLYCGMGRIYLQMGDVEAAEKCFNKANGSGDQNDPQVKCRQLMNKGFVALGENRFQDAHNFFNESLKIEPENAVAVNNMAVCSLYNGKLKEALSTLENLVHSSPEKYMQEGILFNLCTLYELASSKAVQKKQALLDLVSKHKGNGFNVACLKMV